MALLHFTNKGIYCQQADIFIDPWKKVSRALITHAHSDHARHGHLSYLCTPPTAPILKIRLGKKINVQSIDYGKNIIINGVTFSFHPAGHTIGSAQIKAEYRGEIWVVSGDYKIENDGISEAFEPVLCQHFITECTFGIPIYSWIPQHLVFDQINSWWARNSEQKIPSVISAYSLGKAQRLIHNVNHSIGPVFTHSSIENTNLAFRNIGIKIKKTRELKGRFANLDLEHALIIAPSMSQLGNYLTGCKKVNFATASGWMMCRKGKRWRNFDRGFTLSDHADWKGLNLAIKESGAQHIYPTHGTTGVFSRWLTEQGYNSKVIETSFSDKNIEE